MNLDEQRFAVASADHLDTVAALADEAVAKAERRVEKVRAELAAAEESLEQAQRDAEQANADAAKAQQVAGGDPESLDAAARAALESNDVVAHADVAQMKTES